MDNVGCTLNHRWESFPVEILLSWPKSVFYVSLLTSIIPAKHFKLQQEHQSHFDPEQNHDQTRFSIRNRDGYTVMNENPYQHIVYTKASNI